MSFAIWSSLGRREHAISRASKILNIAVEIGKRRELHICSPCCERWTLELLLAVALASCDCSALEPGLIFIRALMPENNWACVPSKTVACDSASSLAAGLPSAGTIRHREVTWGVAWLTGNNASVPCR